MGYDWRMCWNLIIWDVFWTNLVQMNQCHRKVVSERSTAGVIRSLVNARGLQFEWMSHCSSEPLTLMRCHSFMKTWKGRNLSGPSP